MSDEPVRFEHEMRFGARLMDADGGVRFGLWAPAAPRLELVLRQAGDADLHWSTQPDEQGWHEVVVAQAGAGSRYVWRLDGHLDWPDPASRRNPDGVHGFSEVIDPRAFDWPAQAQTWAGRPWHETVMYELHIGAFTPEGTFAAAQARLADLADIGITAVQLMPLASFPGRFGWGYDGVLPFAPHSAYGTPDDLKRFVQAAHELGIMVLLDVVYNHFGPDGNHLPTYAPAFMTERHHTAWGAAINFDGPGSETVRQFFIDNALYWLGEYRFDGLRFDAVHAMVDDSRPDIMATLSERVRAAFPGRHIHLVVENDSNDPDRLGEPGQPGRFEGQWNGDFHHALHVLLTGERDGYYAQYGDQPLDQLARSLTHGLVWQGGPHNAEHAPPRRRCDVAVPLGTMVNFLHNHDQVGNRALGERLTQLIEPAPLRLISAMLLLNPATPMLFMGEEFGAATPFLYFADWHGELRQAVTQGRRREFAQFEHFSDPAVRERIPDPCTEATFLASKLDWQALTQPAAQQWRAYIAELLDLRQRWLTPHLSVLRTGEHQSSRIGTRALSVRWAFDVGMVLEMVVNLSDAELALGNSRSPLILERAFCTVGQVSAERMGPWSGCWWWTDPLDGGHQPGRWPHPGPNDAAPPTRRQD